MKHEIKLDINFNSYGNNNIIKYLIECEPNTYINIYLSLIIAYLNHPNKNIAILIFSNIITFHYIY